MGWILTGFGVTLAVFIAAGIVLVLFRRYRVGWQWGARNVWSICEECRQRLSWLWAPREEKVGLVKAQHPTGQTIPGLYRQAGNTSHHILHSESDLRLDAQGAFTRFESVDRDLHPPIGGTSIPPQPLRPAPQPKPIARPRPSPLHAPNASENLRLQDIGPAPLTPPPQGLPAPGNGPQHRGQSAFIFPSEPKPGYKYEVKQAMKHSSESSQTSSHGVFGGGVFENSGLGQCQDYVFPSGGYDGLKMKSDHESFAGTGSFQQYGSAGEQRAVRYPALPATKEETEQLAEPFGSRESGQRTLGSIYNPRHARTELRSSLSGYAGGSSTAQTIMESIYGPQAASKMLQNGQNGTETSCCNSQGGGSSQNQSLIEMTPFRAQLQNVPEGEAGASHTIGHNTMAKSQGFQNASQMMQSKQPAIYSFYAGQNSQTTAQDHKTISQSTSKGRGLQDNASVSSLLSDNPHPGPVPPPAPPDPPNGGHSTLRKNGPTTGERIFNALRSVTSQSYIDASEFYNSVLSSAQQVQRFTFPPSESSEDGTPSHRTPNDAQGFYVEPEMPGLTKTGRGSDLYSPELNLEAHRTAQEVYNSLQDPPASPLLLKDLSQEPHPYLTDPSFTRTSEDIFNSLEQRRKSMERLNGFQDYTEVEITDPPRRRSNQDLCTALEEVQMKRRLSQSAEESYPGFGIGEIVESLPDSRRGSQGPEPEPPPDESTLKRAVSCDSVCSDTSVVLGDLEETPIVGHLCVGLEYERWGGRGGEGDLTVSVLEARDLITSDGRPAQNTFVRVCLLPDRQTHVQTRLYRSSPSPSYQEKFLFPLDGGPVGRSLLVEVFSVDISMGGGASLLAEASLKLGPAPRPPATTWLPLIGTALPIPHLGELMFSLSYLPTAERLTLVVVKARNLRGANPLPGDTFVKVYLLQHGKKMHKKRTSVKKGEKSPIFNEAIIFNVPAHALQSIQLRLTVAEAGEPRAYPVGHVIVGGDASGRALAHWRQMLTALRRPVAMWHPLRK
ncbi:uncharacterized protein LOC124184703 [Neodiprion fabricii]|uniref:uncharacterized protein LOC124184703 n=1 Tax=Neodiprion fabricii TaxID=2872261 RepID=UPI001ED90D5E|nr:uncharacterized protein LOC124184703 [Neodiprion fabricii]XP_046430665.1 uncharacterized protein LOC124184703 [Neodiprion fabricii]